MPSKVGVQHRLATQTLASIAAITIGIALNLQKNTEDSKGHVKIAESVPAGNNGTNEMKMLEIA